MLQYNLLGFRCKYLPQKNSSTTNEMTSALELVNLRNALLEHPHVPCKGDHWLLDQACSNASQQQKTTLPNFQRAVAG
jgi:hypothetical protein